MKAEELNLRKHQVLELNQQQVPVMEIVRQVGLSYGTVSKVLKQGAVTPPQRRGRKSGTGSALTPEQQRMVLTILRTPPRAPGVAGLTWTKEAVAAVINAQLQIALAPRTVDKYLAGWGLGRSGPQVHPAAGSTANVNAWWEANGDALSREAATNHSRILWLNRIVTLEGADHWYAPGTTIKSKFLQLLSAETGKGKRYWLVFPGGDSQRNEIRFLENLYKELRHKLFLIRTAGPIYHRSEIIRHVEQSDGRIRIFPGTE